MAKTVLELDDILDLRAYERVRDDFRRGVIARKRPRRIALGPIVTVVFECVDTVRFQVQEMARAERITTDQGIQDELDIYNRLLPVPGELSATLFVELTTEEQLRHWLPRLVGIERSLCFEIGSDRGASAVAGVPESTHAAALTRETVTPAVHYLRFPFTPDAVERFEAADEVCLSLHHAEYDAVQILAPDTRHELLGDLTGRTEALSLG